MHAYGWVLHSSPLRETSGFNPSPHLGSVKGKALKNLSDYPPLGRYVTSLGKLAEFITRYMELLS